MKVSFLIARRYLFAKKSAGFINLLSGITLVGVSIGTAALVVILSVFNGLQGLVEDLFSRFDAEIQIEIVEGKFFEPDSTFIKQLKSNPKIESFSFILEENALVSYDGKEALVQLMGIDTNWLKQTSFTEVLESGTISHWTLKGSKSPKGLIAGNGLAYQLGLSVSDIFNPVSIYIPKKGKKVGLNPDQAFNRQVLFVDAVFNVQPEINAKYLLVPISKMRELLTEPTRISSLNLSLKPGVNLKEVQAEVKKIFGSDFKVSNRYEQQEDIYKIFKSEKLWSFLLVGFIVFIAILNLLGSLTMLVIDKNEDIKTLRTMGASVAFIRNIFLFEGLLITYIGCAIGLTIGVVFVLLQQQFGFIGFSTNAIMVVDAYPMQLKIGDLLAIFGMISVMGFLCALYPAYKSV